MWKWEPIQTSSKFYPEGRSESSLVTYMNKLYIFGGRIDDPLNDFWCFDIRTKTWEKLDNNDIQPRYGHSANVYHNIMILFGGSSRDFSFNDMYFYNFDTKKWTTMNVDARPCVRYYHAGNVYKDALWVFAGTTGTTHLNDLQRFDLIKLKWNCVNCSGDIPTERFCPTTVIYEDKLYSFGGYNSITAFDDFKVLDMKTFMWKSIDMKGEIPGSRYGNSMILIGSKIYIWGGYTGSKYTCKFHVFDCKKYDWFIQEADKAPSKRTLQCMEKCNEYVYLFGGYDDSVLGDFYRVQVPLETATLPKIMQVVSKKKFVDVFIIFS